MSMKNLGGRPRKVVVELTEESFKDILTKAYAEADDLRQKSISFYTKAIKDTRENGDIALVGKIAMDSLKIAGTATNTKLQIAKMVGDITFKDVDKDADKAIDGTAVLSNEMKEDVKKLLGEVHTMQRQNQKISVNDAFKEVEKKEMDKINNNINNKTLKKDESE